MKQSGVDHIKQRTIIWVGFGCIIAIALLLTLQDLIQPSLTELNPASTLVGDHEQTGRVRVGEIESTDLAIHYQIGEEASKTIRFPGASYIKVHISRLDLLPGDTIKVSDPDGEQVFTYPGSPYTTDEQEGFWSISIMGDSAVIELQTGEHEDISISPQNRHFYQKALSGAEPTELGVVIDKYARGYPENEIQSLMYGIDSTCGTNQRTDVVCYETSHPTEYQKSHAVARLLTSGIYACTGWRASDQNRVFTNEHCVTSQSDVNATEVRFNYQNLTCGGGVQAAQTVVTGDSLLTDSYNYDMALFTVNDFETISSFGYLDLDVRTPQLNEEIYIPQHGSGDPKQFGIESDMDTGNVCRIDDAIANGRTSNSDTGYYCDTIGGSSGSPVLARSSHAVIGLHHFGISGSSCTSSDMNQGVRIDQIWSLVESYFDTPDVGPLVYDSHTIDDDSTGDSSGNGDGVADCGESIELFVDLLNQGADDAAGVNADISTSDSYVTWIGNTASAYPDISGGGTGTNSDDFDFSLSPDTPDGHTITFNLDITASNGGPWSDTFVITVSCLAPPAAPTSLTASAASSTQVDLSWQDNASDETAYYIERSPDGSTAWSEIDSVAAGVTSYNDTGLECSTAYFYRVRAYRASDGAYSDYSNVDSATTYACQTLDIIPGWNLFTLPLQPITPYTAQSILDEINSQGGACSEIDNWSDSAWHGHLDGGSFSNFDISNGTGYFVKCSLGSSWTIEGTAFTTGVALDLLSGWNLIGIPYPDTGYTAQTLLDDINSQGGACSEIDRWLNSGWDAHIDGLPFNDFDIDPHAGCFIKCSQASSFTPG